ncbi:MAG: hypothetical protein V4692_06655 [Bdellovibrionota bacterium]
MNHELVLLHRPGPERFEASLLENLTEKFSFTTCMRHILLVSSDDVGIIADSIREGDQVFRGEEAYRFLLEVICGLHSPLIGETEVYGQLKNEVAAFQQMATPWNAGLHRIFRSLFQDAKTIREKHLKDLGSQSYGSILRREIKGEKNVHIVGAGHLVQEILPWLAKDGTKIHVHCRDVEKARAVLPSGISIHSLNETIRLEGVLVIAAPVTAEWIKTWVSGNDLRLAADLRADSHVDRVDAIFPRTLVLGELLSRITSNQSALEKRKVEALEQAHALSSERSRHTEYRPFGWEDVCA